MTTDSNALGDGDGRPAATAVAVPTPASPDLDTLEALLYEAAQVDEEGLEAVLARCDVTSHRVAARQLLERDAQAERLLEPPQISSDGSAAPAASVTVRSGRRLASFLGGELGGARRRLLRFTSVARLAVPATFVAIVALHWGEIANSTPILLELGSFLAIVGVAFALRAVAGSRRVDDFSAVAFGAVCAVMVSALLAYCHASHLLHRFGYVSGFGPHLMWILALPLILSIPFSALAVVISASVLMSLCAVTAASAVFGADLGQTLNSENVFALVTMACIGLLIHRAAAALRREMAAGLRFGSYRLEHKLGEGGMGEVWLARHPLLARPAAIKVMRREHLEASPSRREELLERFLREARTTASLESPHTVRVLDYGVLEDGEAFLVMENLEGVDLRSLIRECGPQPVDRVRSILLQACDSLEEAHGKGLVHRDLKPANLMLCRTNRQLDRLKVLDFGIVQVESDHAEPLTRTGALVGTAGYLAPELLARDQAAATPSSDIYALACVAYVLLTGRPVFEAGPPLAQLTAHLRDDPAPPSRHAADLPAAWDALVLSSLAKSPEDRPASIPELARKIEAIEPSGDWSSEDQAAWWLDFPRLSAELGRREVEGVETEGSPKAPGS